jgi:hypothetical protein
MDNPINETSVSDIETDNMLRAVMLDCAIRLERHADSDDIAIILREAADKSYDQLADSNVEIEFDDELLKPVVKRPDFTDPVLRDLVCAMTAYDGIRSLEIAGYEATADSHADLAEKLEALRITLNSKSKETS